MGTWQHAYAHVFPAEELAKLSVDLRAESWREILGRSREREGTFVGERAGEIIGFAGFGPARDPDTSDATGELYAIYVLASEWGRGVGHALMQASLDGLRAAGFHEAILWVLEDNPRTRRFYELGGWALDGTTKSDRLLGFEVAQVRYRTSLG